VFPVTDTRVYQAGWLTDAYNVEILSS
jgi:hypothetical protein